MEKRLIDITDRVLESSIITGKLKSFDRMMKSNKEPYIWKGRCDGEGEVETAEISQKRNRDAKKTDRKH